MKITGFTIVRNAVQFDYPFEESIRSVLPLCDEFIISVGQSDDNTLNRVKAIGSDKIRVIESVWDDSLREGGKVLAAETNKAMEAVPAESDWVFYIQADEVVHEKYYSAISEAMEKWKDDKRVEGLLFNYLHFYGSYDYLAESYKWYRREIRIIRKDHEIYSYRDAQGFRKSNRKLRVKPLDAWIYHYGWVKEPAAMQRKQKTFQKYWHNDQWVEKHIAKAEEFDYSQVDALKKFKGTHPEVMKERIRNKNWQFDHDLSENRYSVKHKLKLFVEKITGYRPGEYKNYKVI